jgi:hypothetical protein
MYKLAGGSFALVLISESWDLGDRVYLGKFTLRWICQLDGIASFDHELYHSLGFESHEGSSENKLSEIRLLSMP